MRSPATDTRSRPAGERTTGRHALPSKVNPGNARRQPMADPRPESLADPGSPTLADRRRGYPGPRPPWAGPVEGGGAHRTQDLDYKQSAGAVYDTGVHQVDASDAGTQRSALYDTGVHRVGRYDSGVHRTDVYEPSEHQLSDDEDSPLYRQGALREVGGGRRRLDAQDRRADGRPDLTVISGDGEPDGEPDRTGDERRPGHLRAIPGERFTR